MSVRISVFKGVAVAKVVVKVGGKRVENVQRRILCSQSVRNAHDPESEHQMGDHVVSCYCWSAKPSCHNCRCLHGIGVGKAGFLASREGGCSCDPCRLERSLGREIGSEQPRRSAGMCSSQERVGGVAERDLDQGQRDPKSS